MLGLIILLLLLLCVMTHPLEYEAASSYLSEVPPTCSDIIALLHEHNVSIVHVPGSDQFQASVLLENGICFDHCPSVVLRPRSVWDVSTAVAIARMHSIPTSVRSGGHGYNCESIKDGGMLIDVRSLKNLTIDLDTMLMHAEAGLRWKDVIPALKRDCVITVHGQCTGVGVSGFSLHGGVHFGALSELYGLSSDNLMGATVVLPDGAVVDVVEEEEEEGEGEQKEHIMMMTGGPVPSVTTKRCSIKNARLYRQLVDTKAIAYLYDEDVVYVDHTITPGNWSCSQLMEALRGAGSNVGVVVTLVLKLHPYPNKHCSRLDRNRLVGEVIIQDDGRITSSLAVVSVSVKEGGEVHAAYLLKALLAAFPDAVSVTLFGLDAFFKAYLFAMRFADLVGRWKALGHTSRGWNMLSALKNNSQHVIHFVVEATWLHSSNISLDELTGAVSVVLLASQEGRSPAALTVPFVYTPEPWSVPSYNLVWGKGHRYAGASLTVGPSGSECDHASNFSRAGHCKGDIALLVVLMEGFVSYRRSSSSKGVCSDCVTVLHRVGEGIRRGGGGGSIFHPYRRSSVLWAEVDCGLFHRHDHRYRQIDSSRDRNSSSAWDRCENWLGTVQSAMEAAAAVGQRFHYINVPNKHSAQSAEDHDSSGGLSSPQIIADAWVEMHISSAHFDRLKKLLDAIDPTGLFSNKSFVRILPTTNTPQTTLIDTSAPATTVCVNAYRKHAFEDVVLVVKVSLALLLMRLSVVPAVHHLLKPMMRRLVAFVM